MKNNIPKFLFLNNTETLPGRSTGSVRLSFIDRSVKKISGIIKDAYLNADSSGEEGLLQKIDARIKIFFMIFFLLIVSFKKEITGEIIIFAVVFFLCLVSKVKIFSFYKRVLFFGFIFGFLIALPSSLNLITGGEIILPVISLESAYDFWIYHIPRDIGITREGALGVAMLSMRVVNSISISFLVLRTTGFTNMMKAMKVLRIPDAFLMIITIAFKYIFIFARTAEDIYLAMKSRLAGPAPAGKMRELTAGRMAFMFRKSVNAYEDVFKAMVSRGFTEDIRIFSHSRLRSMDWIYGFLFFVIGVALIWI